MFTLVVREPGATSAAGTILVNGVDVLCRAEEGDDAWQTGTCTVRLIRLQLTTNLTFPPYLDKLATSLKINTWKGKSKAIVSNGIKFKGHNGPECVNCFTSQVTSDL